MSKGMTDAERNSIEEELEFKRGPWTVEEDTLLIHNINCHGEGRWNMLAKWAGLKRTGKSCRLRWLNYLKPDIKRGNLTPQEQLLILELHSKWGNRWAKIAHHLPGRTDNEIKNYWRTRVQKQARQLKVDANSKSFIDAIRSFWMPSLLERMEQSSSSLLSSSPSASSISKMENRSHSSAIPPLLKDQAPLTSLPSLKSSNNLDENSSTIAINSTMYLPLQDDLRVISKLPKVNYDNTVCYNASPSLIIDAGECYQMDISSCGMEGSDQLAPSCHMEQHDWLEREEGANSLWVLDEVWQSRNTRRDYWHLNI